MIRLPRVFFLIDSIGETGRLTKAEEKKSKIEMGLENTDRFLTSLSKFQSQQEKKEGWISVTIKRGMQRRRPASARQVMY